MIDPNEAAFKTFEFWLRTMGIKFDWVPQDHNKPVPTTLWLRLAEEEDILRFWEKWGVLEQNTPIPESWRTYLQINPRDDRKRMAQMFFVRKKCALCDMYFADHGPEGKCLFGSTTFDVRPRAGP